MSIDDKRPDGKKNIVQTWLLVLVGAFFALMVIQNALETKTAQVGFSYQLEHLVNLDLLNPQESRKTAVSNNLVTFMGQFRDAKTDLGRRKYQFLELLDQKDGIVIEKQKLLEDVSQVKKHVESAARQFLDVTGQSIPPGGAVIVSDVYDTPDEAFHIIVQPGNEKRKDTLESVAQVRQPDEKSLRDLLAIVTTLRSPLIGVGAESMKRSLKECESQLTKALEQKNDPVEDQVVFDKVLATVQSLTSDLYQQKDHVVLSDLRSVREYKDLISRYSVISAELDENALRLERALSDVSNAVWFFNDTELSSTGLTEQDPELYRQWFIKAKEEWNSFDKNKSASFKAPDQPSNRVLEKTFKSEEMPANYVGYFLSFMPVLLILFLLYLAFSKQMKGMGGGGPMDFGKSPARLYPKGTNTVTFKDVAGIDESLEELEEVVEFLKNPQKFTALGGKIPKGVLCVGPPGTGKTLVARAVAGEAHCPFFSISGSDFVEMFVGVGASRIRRMFEDAKKNAPCIIFIDEIDAVGRHRGVGVGGGHDEREQTLNQLLVEMDGFDANEGIIIIAATNRPDVLDKALLRPGRFDRQVIIGLPDIKGRLAILQVHAKRIKLADDVDLMVIAKSTPGSSGADLSNLLNEAALLAARRNRAAVTMQELVEARDKVLYGKERKSLELDKHEKMTTAYHESGHTVVGMSVEHSDPIDKVSIIPRGFSLGATLFLPEKNKVSHWKKELLDQLTVLMGGRAAEELFVHDISSGAQNDIERATRLARSMVCEWGMSDALGTVTYDEHNNGNGDYGFSGMKDKLYSEVTAEHIDTEVRSMLDASYARAKKIVSEKKDVIEQMTSMLLEFETLDADDVKKIFDGTWNIDEKRAHVHDQLEKCRKTPPPVPEEAMEKKV